MPKTIHNSAAAAVAANAAAIVDDGMQPLPAMAADALLDRYQRAAFGYFLRNRNPANGLYADTSRAGSPVSIAVVGFALSSYPVAVERGWIGRAEAVEHCTAALRFFRDSNQDGTAGSTGYKGFYFHFLDRDAGTRVWRCELSMIDTALLIVGALAASRYFDADIPAEAELRGIVDLLYRRIDWRWSQNGGSTIMQGWKPECGFLHYGWEGYSEAIMLYVLALGSPTHPIGDDCFHAWTSTYQWENLYGHGFLYAGPLFIHQFSHAWIDFRGIRDRFMRGKQCDYFENSRRAVHVQRAYACINPRGHAGYDEDCWGFSACEGPSDEVQEADAEPRHLFGYTARGVPYGPDDGTLSPPAVLACLPFEPDLALAAIRTMCDRHPEIVHEHGFTSGFNADLRDRDGRVWVSPGLFGLDQGIIVLMIENHRTGMFWELMRGCRCIVDGLRRAGFDGGWLDAAARDREEA
ncbi:glucoamylase family protein [Luteimonas sp. 22616]|uniref:glucoamylase family protein n=1 Tax=Luteimonas sp. 22616 TaxID=3453951 RepID=UPI003F87DE15